MKNLPRLCQQLKKQAEMVASLYRDKIFGHKNPPRNPLEPIKGPSQACKSFTLNFTSKKWLRISWPLPTRIFAFSILWFMSRIAR